MSKINLNSSIVDKGSNENGTYIKFHDGTMICYGTFGTSNPGWRDYYGTIGMSQLLTVNLPTSFMNNNYSLQITGSNFGTIGGNINSKSNNKFNFYALTHHQFEAYSSDVFINYIAIGRWK